MSSTQALRQLLAVAAAVTVVGCPGTLDDPDRFVDGGGSTCDPSIDVVSDIIRTTEAGGCTSSICHDDVDPGGGLDLLTSSLPAALVGRAPTCEDTTNAGCPGACGGKLLIDPASPEQSYLLEKVRESSPTCGDHMPLGFNLSPAKIACLEAWVEQAAQAAGGAGGSGDGG